MTLGIVSRGHEPMTYRIRIIIDGNKNNEVGPVELEDDKGGKRQ